MNGIQVKSYLFQDNSKISLSSLAEVDEIRRFNLALNESDQGLYQKLIEKIQQAYGSLLPNKDVIRTYWQDEEDELIGFTSDTELQYAIDVMTALKLSKPYEKSLLFKVYVARKPFQGNHHPKREKFQAPPIHFGVVCDNCDGSIIGDRFKCTVCPDYDLCEECMKKDVHSHPMNTINRPQNCLLGRRGPRCRINGEKRCNRNGPFGHFMKEFANFPQFNASNVPLVGNPEQLKNFGENLKKILDPFGIDVSYYVDSLNKTEEPKPQETKEQTEKNKETERQEEMKQAEKNTESKETTEESMMDDLEPTVTQKPDETACTSVSESESLIDLQKSVVEEAPFESAINALKEVATASEETASAPEKAESLIDGFNLVDIEKELKIIKAIEQLKSMGYTDDGGWLTRLATAKNGNINAVLDAVSPVKR